MFQCFATPVYVAMFVMLQFVYIYVHKAIVRNL